ncbi:hypothetical protein MMC09_005916 [Bachmanniomyces sp. S44760]|nr:hypothetical protein [Bachmanniomyces sp. S44760]
MPSIRYYNQTAPFWDFIANLETAANDAANGGARGPEQQNTTQQPQEGPSDPPKYDGPPPSDGPEKPPGDGPDQPHQPHHGGQHHGPHHRHGSPPGCGWGRRGGPHRGGWGGPGLCRGREGFPGRGGFPFGGFRGRFGPEGFTGFGNGEGFDMSSIGQFFAEQLGMNPEADSEKPKDKTSQSKDFAPPCDVFNTEDAYIIHFSLPGAKKEDVGVNWDAEKSELSIAGVIYRPGDEDFLKTLAMDEREVGVFEKKVRLGSRAKPAAVEHDSITAKMEDGVLIVTVPKVDAEYVEIKKVDIE